jgi:hypothetical protein
MKISKTVLASTAAIALAAILTGCASTPVVPPITAYKKVIKTSVALMAKKGLVENCTDMNGKPSYKLVDDPNFAGDYTAAVHDLVANTYELIYESDAFTPYALQSGLTYGDKAKYGANNDEFLVTSDPMGDGKKTTSTYQSKDGIFVSGTWASKTKCALTYAVTAADDEIIAKAKESLNN